MDIWEKMYEEAQKLYNPHEVSDFVYANHVVAAVEAEDGQIFTGFCMEGTCGVFHLCAERAALFNMYQFSGQTKVKKVLAFRDKPPYGINCSQLPRPLKSVVFSMLTKSEYEIEYDSTFNLNG